MRLLTMAYRKDRRSYVGERFGELTVIAEVDPKHTNRRFECRCDCGSVTVKYIANLTQGKSRSCGCNWIDRSVKGRAAIIAARHARSQQSDDGRICLTCNTWKPWPAFATSSKNTNSGRASNCIECGTWRTVSAKFGVSKDEWMHLWDLQQYSCGLCKGEMGVVDARRFSVDHDHSCCGDERGCKKCIRGLLCIKCNLMLGYAEQSEANRERFADYLSRRPFQDVGDVNV